MGTRADFYVGRGKDAKWRGSIAWDGYPDGIPDEIKTAKTDEEFDRAVLEMARQREDWSSPDHGWPWPWDDSNTTDFAYAFDGDRVWRTCFGYGWVEATADEPEDDDRERPPKVEFPDMSDKKAVTWGPRSGLLIIGGG